MLRGAQIPPDPWLSSSFKRSTALDLFVPRAQKKASQGRLETLHGSVGDKEVDTLEQLDMRLLAGWKLSALERGSQ